MTRAFMRIPPDDEDLLYMHSASSTELWRVLKEWQLARDRYDLPESDPKIVAQREQHLLRWERTLRELKPWD